MSKAKARLWAEVCDLWGNGCPPKEREAHETIADIVAEMRRGTRLPGYWRSCDVNKILQYHADRIDAALSGDGAGENKKGKQQMSKYIRVNIVEAEPMTRGDYYNLRGLVTTVDEDLAAEGYLVVYPDGRENWCHKAQFEEGSRPIDGMTFGMAIEAMKQGAKVARRGWNGKGMWLCIPLCDGPKEIPATGIWGKPNAEYAEQNGGKVTVVPYITMKAADGTIVMGWLASQTDMLAEDWCIVE